MRASERGGGGLHLLVEIEGHVRELLLDVAHDLTLGGGGEGVATLGQDLHHVVGEIAAGQIQTKDGVGQRITLIDGHSVGNTVARVEHDTGGTARGIERKHGLDGDVHSGGVEGLEHDLGHLLAVGLGVEGGLSEEHGVLLGGDTELVVEGVVPDLLHVVPVGHDAVLDGVLEGEDTTLALGLVTDIRVLLAHTNHHSGLTGTSDDRRENGAGSIVSGETSLAHTGSIVHHECRYLIFSHICEGKLA